ncbi:MULTISPECIES: (deoxy)nucleoside triphosphate pyrophosphohydrolase [Prauserella salsuginis group]|uniref:8-oxo-dGTP diphosphatase n=2 Tax=Prauserella salsuginis group TaxID=2893672 RepID=A0A839XMI3_9PSEU|nr:MULTISPECIES: NUDIX domain-containing protein [Prauserella salsuginis group]MBB3663847.1 8-oxo-dGTP diphosphatase [Prauserella sediminis]MCR3722371.1 8-oxo-dGTP diphosphatase [Prauserella flava]MCR3736813.1 8-oxo-dGTP diphosphatase [Prauserella salsuginis]
MDGVIVGAAIVDDGKLLVGQRAYPDDVAGLWELPGGRVEPGESETEALVRECHEELGVDVTVGVRIGGDIALRGGAVLRVYAAALVDSGATPQAAEHKALQWVGADEVAAVDWLPADRALIPELEELLG